MEVPYFVMHPSVKVTAVVYAPSTEKARTTFLDWLERKGYLRRADRQLLRKNMVANRLEDSNVQSDVVLHYGYQDISVRPATFRPGASDEEVLGEVRAWDAAEKIAEANPWPEEPSTVEMLDLPREEPGPKMPIQKVMLRGFQ